MAKTSTIACSVVVPASEAETRSYLTLPGCASRFPRDWPSPPGFSNLHALDAALRVGMQVQAQSPEESLVELRVARPNQRETRQGLLHALRTLGQLRLDMPRWRALRGLHPTMANASPPRMLVSGSSGNLGRRMVAMFEGLGWRVDRLVRSKELRQGAHFREWYWDASTTIDGASLEGADVVVHLAGRPITAMRWSRQDRAEFRNSRVNATTLLARAIRHCKRPPKLLVCASGIHIYGDRGEETILDSAGPGTGFLADLTRDWEQASTIAREGPTGVRTVLLRMPMVLDRDGGVLRGLVPSFRLGMGMVMGTGQQWWPWVAMEDVLGVVVHAILTPGLQGPVNVVAPQEVRAHEFSRAMALEVDKGLFCQIPPALVRAIFGTQAEAALHSVRAVPQVLRATGYAHALPGLSQVLAWELAQDPARLARACGVVLAATSGPARAANAPA